MYGAYRDFFIASVGASAACIGLLFVSLSFIENDGVSEQAKAWRRILANSSFCQLATIFFVSLAGLLPDPKSFAFVGIVMGALGVFVQIRIWPKITIGDRPERRVPTVLGIAATAAYALLIISGIILVRDYSNLRFAHLLIVSLIILYAGALARAWEITGIKKR
jgi:hypothetical protein